jgi:DEAD/DEAH box helicase domain-containing protein
LVETIDWENKKAIASHHHVDYYTQAISTSDVEIQSSIKDKDIGYKLSFGNVKVTEHYFAYRKKTYDELLDIIPLDLAPLEFETKAVWIEIPSSIVEKLKTKKKDFPGGIHALEHATIALSPLFALCDRWDIGGTSYPSFPADGTSKIFIYDGFPGGIGIAEKLFEKWRILFSNVRKLINECSCSEGCPSCVQSPKCGNENSPLSKSVALELLDELQLLSEN